MTSDDDKRPRRILVIDDHRAIHDDFAKILNRAPSEAATALDDLERDLFAEPSPPEGEALATLAFDVAFASQGEEGVRVARQAQEAGVPFAVAFVDMRMPPGWDGVRTIKELWRVDPELQCVICTAYSDYSWEQILDELGTSDRLLLLRKPFDSVEVCQLACALTEKWHLARRAHLKLEQLRAMVDEQTRHLEVTNRRLAESEARYALAAAGSNDGLWDWDLVRGEVFYSPRWLALVGLPPEAPFDGVLASWLARLHEEDHERVSLELARLALGEAAHVSIEYRMRHADGQFRWFHCRGAVHRDDEGRPARAAGSQTDITNRKMAELQLAREARHDPLTGLANRALLTERLEGCLTRARVEPDYRYAVLFIDLDRFKVVNDSLGHVVGDALLTALAERLSVLARAHDLGPGAETEVARLGGDEFVVLVAGQSDDARVTSLAERLLAGAAEPIPVGEHVLSASMSIGVAFGDPSYERALDVLRDADTALYRAKEDGRGCLGVFTGELREAADTRFQIESELRGVCERGELCLQYQPIVALTTGELRHFEALVRWRHPVRGLVPPSSFIPVAEENGDIVAIGRWVLEAACRQARAWRDVAPEAAHVPIAVNVASRQLSDPGFVATVERALATSRLPVDALWLEVTESAAMNPRALETCNRLAALGVRLSLDDFGTGYSSLSYLTRMPVEALKVDRSFVSRMGDSPMNASIVQAVVALGSAMNMLVIAEGIETSAQAEALRRLGCSAGQGYLWSRPVDAEHAFEFLVRRRCDPLPPRSQRPSRAPSLRPSHVPTMTPARRLAATG